MVLLTGDIHGEVFRIQNIIERLRLTAADTIVILGDVGMNYYGNRKGDRHRKKRLNGCAVPILCIHGNHEMRPETIESYREVQWHGGTVYVEDDYPNLLFAKDGEVYDLDGQMLRLSSWARLDMIVMSNSPLLSIVQMFSFSK